MNWLKSLPVSYEGLLNDIKVINFSVALDEVELLLPAGLKAMNFEGRAMISLADLQLCEMRPKYLPKWLALNYRHVALRVLVERKKAGSGTEPAIYFLKSFCGSACLVCGGDFLTDYRLCKAKIKGANMTSIETPNTFLNYTLSGQNDIVDEQDICRTARLNTAYAVHGGDIWQTQIQPDDWPLEPVNCSAFTTNLFNDYRVEAAYEVKGTLDFSRSVPSLINGAQKREHVLPFRVRCSPL